MDEFSSNDNLLNKIVQYSFFTDARSKQLDGTKYYSQWKDGKHEGMV